MVRVYIAISLSFLTACGSISASAKRTAAGAPAAEKQTAATDTSANDATKNNNSATTTNTNTNTVTKTTVVAPPAWPKIALGSPRRTYVMQAIDSENVSDSTLEKADGLVIRTKWSTIEPTAGNFNLTWVKGQIARAKKAGKFIQLEVLSGDDAPGWLEGLGAKIFKFSDGQIPLPWDAVFQARYALMIDHIKKNLDWSKITHFHAMGADNAEWHYTQFDSGAFYNIASYSDEKMVGAHVQAMDTLVRTLPAVVMVCDIGDHGRGWTAQAIAELKRQFEGRVGFQMDSLKATTSRTYEGYTRIRDAAAEGHHAGFEMVGPSLGAGGAPVARFEGPFSSAIAIADTTSAQWLIVYQADL